MFSTLNIKMSIFIMGIALLAIVLTAVVAPRTNRIFYDEDIYQEQGLNLSHLHRAQVCDEGNMEFGVLQCSRWNYNKWPSGYPFLLSIFYSLFGISEKVAFLLNNFNCFLCVFIVFFLTSILFENSMAGMLAALSFAIIPMNATWSNTASVEPSSAGVAALAMLMWFLFIKYERDSLLFLAMMVTVFSAQFRMESLLLFPLVVLTLSLFRPKTFLELRFWLIVLLASILLIPLVGHTFAVKDEPWGAVGEARFSFQNFQNNLPTNLGFYFKNNKFPLFVSLFALIGAGWVGRWRERLVFGTWFLTFWGIFAFFYAGSYEYGADIRYSLVSYIPLAALAGFGAYSVASWIKAIRPNWLPYHIIVTLLVVNFANFLPLIHAEGEEAWEARTDHEFAYQIAQWLPKNSIVLTHNPCMFFLWGKNAAQMSIASMEINHVRDFYLKRYSEGVFLHWNYWCNTDDPDQVKFCGECLEKYEIKEVMSKKMWRERLALYQIVKPKVENRAP